MCFREMYVSVYNTSIILCVRTCVWKVTPPAHLLPTALIEASMSSQKGTTFVSPVWPGLFKWAAFPIDSDHIFCSRHMKAAVSGVLNVFVQKILTHTEQRRLAVQAVFQPIVGCSEI